MSFDDVLARVRQQMYQPLAEMVDREMLQPDSRGVARVPVGQTDPRRLVGAGPTRWHSRHHDRVCETGKVCHETREQAAVHAERGMTDGRVDPGCHLTPYRCAKCAAWHVGNHYIVFPKD